MVYILDSLAYFAQLELAQPLLIRDWKWFSLNTKMFPYSWRRILTDFPCTHHDHGEFRVQWPKRVGDPKPLSAGASQWARAAFKRPELQYSPTWRNKNETRLSPRRKQQHHQSSRPLPFKSAAPSRTAVVKQTN